LTEKIILIFAYVVLQGVLLWGLGTIRIDSLARVRWRTVCSFISLSAVAFLLTLAGFCLIIVMVQTAQNKFSGVPQSLNRIFDSRILIGAWVFWLVVGLAYWRGRASPTVPGRIVKALLATSWIEFSLALPIDIAARNRSQDCYCAPGSWFALVALVPALIFCVGPGIYLLYLREHELSLSDSNRTREILFRKTSVRRRANQTKVDTYVSNAQTLSLIAIALGFVGFQLGIFNNQRSNLFSEARDLVIVRYLKTKYGNDGHLKKSIQEQTGDPRAVTITNAPFGVLVVTADPNPSTPEDVSLLGFEIPRSLTGAFTAKVTQDQESWSTRKFSLDRLPPGRLEQILNDLDVSESSDLSRTIPQIKEKLYRKHVKLPSLDFWDFSTEAAAWVVALLAISVLVALRNRNSLRQILQGSDGGIAEPWLILDAEAFGERAVAAAWLVGIPLSGWLASFGLILSVMNSFEAASPAPNSLAVGLAYLLFTILVAASTWTGAGIVTDLVRIREARRIVRDTPEDGIADGA
jgi:small basic protein